MPLDISSRSVIIYLFPAGTARGDSPCATAPLEVGIDALGARRDIQVHCGVSIGTIDGSVSGPLGLDGEPRNSPEWRFGLVTGRVGLMKSLGVGSVCGSV